MPRAYPGGYVMVDMGGVDIQVYNTPVTVAGLYADLDAAIDTNKPVILTNTHYGQGNYTSPIHGELAIDSGNILIMVNNVQITVTENDQVTVATLVPGAVTAPAAVTNLTATKTDDGIQITWTAADRALWYVIARQKDGGSYLNVDQDVTGTSFLDTSTLSAGSYVYRVRAYNLFGGGSAVNADPIVIT